MKHSIPRYIILAALITATFLLLIITPTRSAATPSAVKPKIILRLWGGLWGLPAKDETMPWMRATRAVFEEFQKEHPEIEIISSTGLTIQGPASESNFLLAMAGGTAPDVFYVNFRKMHTYIGQNFMQPLDEFIKSDPEILARVHPQIRSVITVDGHVYCIPWFQGATALFYRKDMFREAGLDPNKPPRNWDEFYEYSKKLTVPEKGQYGFFFPATQGAYYLTNFIWQAGGDVVQRDKAGKYRVVFNSPAGVAALEYFAKMTKGEWTRNGKTYHGVANYLSGDYKQEIKLGKLAMWFADTYDAVTTRSEVNPSLLGVAPLPAGPTGIKANQINAGMWAMSSQIKDPRVREAAWQYIKFMSGPKAEEIRTRSYVENGLWKYVSPDKLERYGYHEYVAEIPEVWMDASKDAFKHGRPEPNGPNLEMIYNEMDPPMQAIYQNPNANAKALLDACANRINIKLLGNVRPDEMRNKRAVAWVILLGILSFIAAAVTRQVRSLRLARALDAGGPTMTVRGGFKVHLTAWMFMAPALLSVFTWAYYPLLRGMVMAFQDYRILGDAKFVGLDNFIQVMGSDVFWRALFNSFLYVGLSLSIGFFVPIILALMLAEVPKGKMLFRTLFYLPAVTSGLVIMFLWKWFYDPSPQGLFNALMIWLHIPTQVWLNDSHLAMLCVILPVIWAGAGPGCIIYLAALKSIPEEMYEAAELDGAGIWSKVRHVVFPMLKPLIIINFVGAFIGAFKAMENIFVMTGGGPNYATHVVGLDIWYNAFMFLKFGLATSEAWIMGSLLIGFTIYQLRILKDLKFSASG
ncbi:MAG: extracellular solute-binding protein [Armatimonadetes bacterium]|nr:extracellular solute-binding protein [Armatimonadota bacterium]